MKNRIAAILKIRLARALGLITLGLTGLAILFVVSLPEPLVERSRFVRYEDALLVTDRDELPLRYARASQLDRRWVRLSEISPHLIQAVIAVEDARFREHHGVDWVSTVRATLSLILPNHRLSGASTITQQLVKLVYERPHGAWSKAVEIVRAMALEEILSKDEILEHYLNRLPYGNHIVGVERASQAYFGHSASTLTLSEAALLAGIPQGPSITEPRRHRPRAMARREHVLARLRRLGWYDPRDIESAERESIAIQSGSLRPWEAPRFVDEVLRARARREVVAANGRLRTSLDLSLQRQAEDLLRARVGELESRGVRNGAAVVLANGTGEVLAYVGAARRGADYPGGAMDLAQAKRQPGSTLKPFVYQLFFERGGTPATILDDMVTPMTGFAGSIYAPRDYDGLERGPIRARVALASSLNLAALDAARQLGSERILRRFEQLQIAELPSASEVGPAVVLGGADVSVLELAHAYLVLARDGSAIPTRYTPGVAESETRVMEDDSAESIRDVLRDSRARREAFGADLVEWTSEEFALKTGTSSGWRDAWTAVFDDRFTVVVWLGDPAGAGMDRVSGFEGAAPAAVRILDAARRRANTWEPAIREFEVERPSLMSVSICAQTGLRSGPECRHRVTERVASERVPTETCQQHDPDGSVRLHPRYADWIRRAHPLYARVDFESLPTHHRPEIVYPAAGAALLLDARQGETRIPLRATVDGARVDGEWEIDGRPWVESTWPLTRGEHRFIVRYAGEASETHAIRVEASGGT